VEKIDHLQGRIRCKVKYRQYGRRSGRKAVVEVGLNGKIIKGVLFGVRKIILLKLKMMKIFKNLF
jgi:hypothetical protein